MFYCEACQKQNKWPRGFSFSFGNCESCGTRALCYDVHHSHLPKVDNDIQPSLGLPAGSTSHVGGSTSRRLLNGD